jgi:hypothetical protein
MAAAVAPAVPSVPIPPAVRGRRATPSRRHSVPLKHETPTRSAEPKNRAFCRQASARQTEHGVPSNGLGVSSHAREVATRNVFLPLAPLAAHSFTLRVRPLHGLQRIRGPTRTTA